MSNRKGYNISYRLISHGTVRVWADSEEEAKKSLLQLYINGETNPINTNIEELSTTDSEIEVISTDAIDPLVGDLLTATRPAQSYPGVDDATPVIRTVN